MVSRSRADAGADGDVSAVPRRAVVTGLHEYNATQRARPPLVPSGYLGIGHPWEALFENWESEFLQMAVFVLLTTVPDQKGSPESRRPGVKEFVDADPAILPATRMRPGPSGAAGGYCALYETFVGPCVRRALPAVVGRARRLAATRNIAATRSHTGS